MQVFPKVILFLFGLGFFQSHAIAVKAKPIYTGENFYYTYHKSKKILAAHKINNEDLVASIKLDDLEKSAAIFGNNRIKIVTNSSKMRVAHFKNLLFDQKDKLYLTFNVKYPSSYLLYLVEFDKTSMTFKRRKIPAPRPSVEKLPFNATEYAKAGNHIFENYLFQVYAQEDLFIVEIKSLDEEDPKKVIKRFTFNKDEAIDFRNSPIMEETNVDRTYWPQFLNNKRLLSDKGVTPRKEKLDIFYWQPVHSREILNKDAEKASTKFLRISAQRNIGILVKRVGEQALELSIGNYMYKNKQGSLYNPFSAGGIYVPNGSVSESAMIFISYLSLPGFDHLSNETLQEKGFE